MKLVNRCLCFFALLGLRALIALEVFLLALLLTSPVCCILWSVLDLIHTVPKLPCPFIFIWLSFSALIFVPMYIIVEIGAHKE